MEQLVYQPSFQSVGKQDWWNSLTFKISSTITTLNLSTKMARLLFTSFGTIALMLLDVSHGVELGEITSDSEEADTSSHSAGTDIILHPGEHPAISQKQIANILDLVLEIHKSLVNIEHEVTTSPNILEQLKQLILPKLRKLKDETSEDCLSNIERWMQKEPRKLLLFLQQVKLVESLFARLPGKDVVF